MKAIARLILLILLAGGISTAYSQSTLIANFGWSPDTACLGQRVQFADSSQGVGVLGYYMWDFGDSTVLFNMNPNPTHLYSTPGTYTVNMCVYDSLQNDSACKSKTIIVQICGPIPPLVTGIGGPDSLCLNTGSWANFTDSTSGGSGQYTYFWDFGNGQTSASFNAWTTYSQPGTYTVQHCAYDAFTGDTACATKTLVVQGGNCGPPMAVTMGWWAQNLCIGQPIQFWDSVTFSSGQTRITWDFGDGTSSTNNYPTHTYAVPDTYVVTLCVFDSLRNDSACDSDTLIIGGRCGPPLVVGGIWASRDTVCPGQTVQFFDSTSGLLGNEKYQWDFGDGNGSNQLYPSHSYASPGSYTVTLCVIDTVLWDTSCASTLMQVLATCVDTLSGYVFLDVNGNLAYDAGDLGLANQPVQIFPGPVQVFTDAQGYYEEPAALGQYIVMAPNISGLGNTSPSTGQYIHSLTGNYSNYSGDFGYDTLVTNFDLRVSMYCRNTRPGNLTYVSLYYINRGTQPVQATLTLTYGSQVTFSSALGGVNDAVNHTVTWNLGIVQPTNSYYLARAYFQVPATGLTLGTYVQHSAQITPISGDLNPSNNTRTCNSLVTNSYDPNDKSVEEGEGPTGLINGNERLHYTIRFQNTGNDTAYLVVVKDQLDPNLDLSTLQMEGASHNYRLRIDKLGEATWTFENIMLPDSNVNEPESNGHILYSVKPKAGLSPGATIHNTANIYFDFNSPIITNTTVNTLRSSTALDPGATLTGVSAYPNPATDRVLLTFENETGQTVRMHIMDARGRLLEMIETQRSEAEISVESYPSGIYFYHIQDEQGRQASGKLVKK